MRRVAAVCFFGIFVVAGVKAADFDYPELTVTPRATERLEMEARLESSRTWSTHIPIQVSALTTLTSALIQTANSDSRKDPDKRAVIGGLIVGGGWLAATTVLSIAHKPYSSALNEANTLPRKTQREQLIRERTAEQHMESAAALARRLSWLSVATNLAVSGYMLDKALKGTLSVVADGVSMAMAFAPIVFQYRWQNVAFEQREYKKKIYAPIAASGAIMAEPGTGRLSPGVKLSYSF